MKISIRQNVGYWPPEGKAPHTSSAWYARLDGGVEIGAITPAEAVGKLVLGSDLFDILAVCNSCGAEFTPDNVHSPGARCYRCLAEKGPIMFQSPQPRKEKRINRVKRT